MLKAGAVAATLIVPDATDVVIAGAIAKSGSLRKAANAYSEYRDISKPRAKVENRATDVKRSDFENNLQDSGFTKSQSRDGQVTNFESGNIKYTVRDKANSHDSSTADAFVDGQKTTKIRLKRDDQ